MTREEIEILLRIRDDMSRTVKLLETNFKGAGVAADQLKRKVDSVGQAARNLTVAVTGAFATRALVRNTVGVFADYERGLVNVAKNANLSKVELADFQSELERVAKTIRGVSTDQLVDIAGVAAQMGIEGSKNLSKFTETIAKLTTAAPTIQGEQGAAVISRMLALTGEGVEGVEKFANVLVQLGNTTAATEADILEVATVVSQSAAAFHLSSEAILGLGAAAKQLNFRPELFGAAVGRSLIQLKEAAVSGSKGMQVLSEATGITQDEFQNLLNSHPEEALLLFLKVLGNLDKDVSRKSFLELFNLQAEENQRVMGAAAENVGLFVEKLKTANDEGQQQIALNREYARGADAQKSAIDRLSNSWQLFKVAFGEALKPIADFIIETLADVLQNATAILKAIPGPIKAVGAALVVLGTALVPIVASFKLLKAVFTTLKFGAVAESLGLIGVNAGVAAKSVGLLGLAMRGLAALAIADVIATGIENIAKSAGEMFGNYLVKNHPDTAKWLWETFYKDSAIEAAAKKSRERFDAAFAANKDSAGALKTMLEGMDKVASDAGKSAGQNFAEGFKQVPLLADVDRQALANLDTLTQNQQAIKSYERAIRNLQRISAKGNFTPTQASDVATKETLARYNKLLEVQRRLADPVAQRVRELEDEGRQAAAITGEQKNRLETELAIRDVLEQKGILTEAETQQLKQQLTQLQQNRREAELANRTFDLDQQIAATQQLTALGRIELEVQQDIAKMIREQGDYSDEQIAAYRQKLTILKQTQAAQSLLDSLNPVGATNREYESQLKLIRSLGLADKERLALEQQLAWNTRQQRDPIGDRVREMKQEVALLGMSARQQGIERQVIDEVNSLKDKGVTVTDELTDAIRRYTTAMDEANRLSSVGIQHYVDSLGTFKEEFAKLQEDAASGFVDSLIDGINGNNLGGALRSFGVNLGKQMVSFAVKGIFRDIMKNFDLGNGAKKDALAKAKDAANDIDALKKTATASMTVDAGVVYINGVPAGGVPGLNDTPGAGSPSNGNYAPGSITRQALAPLQAANENVAKSQMSVADQYTSYGKAMQDVKVATDNASKGLVDLGNGLKMTPDAFDAKQRMVNAEAARAANPNGLRGGLGINGANTAPIKADTVQFTGNANASAALAAIEKVAPTRAAGMDMSNVGGFLNSQSKDLLSKIDPNLAKIAVNAQKYMKPGETFQVAPSTVRTLEQQRQYVAEGRSQTMNSNHLTGRAMDLNLYKSGKYTGDFGDYGSMAAAMKQSAQELGIPMNWGGDWKSLKDGPHFELPRGFKGGATSPMSMLPTTMQAPGARPGDMGVDTSAITGSISQVNTQLTTLGTTMQGVGTKVQMVNPQVQQLGPALQQAGSSASTASTGFVSAGTQTQMAGTYAQAAGPQFQQAGTAIQSAGQQAATAGQQAQSASPSMGGLGQGIGGLASQALSAIPGLGKFGGLLSSVLNTLFSSLGNAGGGSSGGGLFGSILGALFHTGGSVGSTRTPMRALPAGAWAGAKRFHTGLGNDEYTAILQRGERVLTRAQDNDNRRIIKDLSDRVIELQGGSGISKSSNGGRQIVQNTTFQISTPNPDGFRKSEGQMMANVGLGLRRAGARNG